VLVYKAIIKGSSKRYVGCTTRTLAVRKYGHHRDAIVGSPYPFHCAIRKYGKESVSWEVLEDGITDFKILEEREQYWIKVENTFKPNGYNLTLGGEGAFGHTVSEEAKKLMGAANIGKIPWNKGKSTPEDVKNKISASNKGKHNNPWNKGESLSKDTRAKISASGRGRIAWNKGIPGPPVSDSTRLKISSANKGKKVSEETKCKIREVRLGKTHSESTKLKISKSKKGQQSWNKGAPTSEETKRKIGLANTGRKQSEQTKLKRRLSLVEAHRRKKQLKLMGV